MTAPAHLRIEARAIAEQLGVGSAPVSSVDRVAERLVHLVADATLDGATHVAASMLRSMAEDRRRRADGLRPEGKRRELTRVGAILDAAELLDNLRELTVDPEVTHL